MILNLIFSIFSFHVGRYMRDSKKSNSLITIDLIMEVDKVYKNEQKNLSIPNQVINVSSFLVDRSTRVGQKVMLYPFNYSQK